MSRERCSGVRAVSAAVCGFVALGCGSQANDEPIGFIDEPSICGTSTDFQEVEQLTGTLAVTNAFVNAHQGPVVSLQWRTNLSTVDLDGDGLSDYTSIGTVANGFRWCSGTLVNPDTLLTAAHCFEDGVNGFVFPTSRATGARLTAQETAIALQYNFNFQDDPNNMPRPETSVFAGALLDIRGGGLDYAVVRLQNAPVATFGSTDVAMADARASDTLAIIGHPSGRPKEVSSGSLLGISGDLLTYGDLDTEGGNSGSGILQEENESVVGVHTSGGCLGINPETGSNAGPRIASILANSAPLRDVVWRATTLYATQALSVNDGVTVSESSGPLGTATVASRGTTNIGVTARVGDIWSHGNVTLRDRSVISGDVTTGGSVTRQNLVTVAGTQVTGATMAVPNLAFTISFPTFNQNVNLEPDQTLTLAPGSYGSVNVKSRATLNLSAGNYFFRSFTSEPQSRIMLNKTAGPIVISVRDSMLYSGRLLEAGGAAAQNVVQYFGTAPLAINAPFLGTLIAPNATVTVSTQSVLGHTGAFYGRSLVVHQNQRITHVPFDSWGNLSTP